MKNRFSIFIAVFLLLACKKDPPATPPPPVPAAPVVPWQVTIMPNPCNGIFTINTNSNQPQGVQMFSTIGKKVLDTTIYTTSVINRDTLPQGVYIVTITAGSSHLSRKLLIVK